jgi:hypothetical protein
MMLTCTDLDCARAKKSKIIKKGMKPCAPENSLEPPIYRTSLARVPRRLKSHLQMPGGLTFLQTKATRTCVPNFHHAPPDHCQQEARTAH